VTGAILRQDDVQPVSASEDSASEDSASGISVDKSGEIRTIGADQAGERVVMVAQQSQVIVRDLDRRVNVVIPVPETGVMSARFSDDDRHLLVVTRSHVFIYADKKWQKPIIEISVKSGEIQATSVAPSGQFIAAGTSGGQVEFYDLKSGAEYRRSIAVKSIPRAICMASDTQLVVGNDIGNIEFWDLSTEECRATVKAHTSRVNVISAFPDGRTVATAGRDRALKIWDIESTERITSLAGHPRQIFDIAIASDGKTLATCGLAGDIRIWRTD